MGRSNSKTYLDPRGKINNSHFDTKGIKRERTEKMKTSQLYYSLNDDDRRKEENVDGACSKRGDGVKVR
jgi:hypothetical protein